MGFDKNKQRESLYSQQASTMPKRSIKDSGVIVDDDDDDDGDSEFDFPPFLKNRNF